MTRTHCVSGKHERTPENIGRRAGRNGSGTTFCRPCKLEAARKRKWGQRPATPRGKGRPIEDTLADWVELSAQGYNRRDAAHRMGMNLGALDTAIARGRKRGLIA